MKKYEVYRQDVFDGSPPPNDMGWEPFAASCSVIHSHIPSNEKYVSSEIIWWKKCIEEGGGLQHGQQVIQSCTEVLSHILHGLQNMRVTLDKISTLLSAKEEEVCVTCGGNGKIMSGWTTEKCPRCNGERMIPKKLNDLDLPDSDVW
jgi:predicted RNA-binding Zn-ribbon protein involved in translation (DUF1610 family)